MLAAFFTIAFLLAVVGQWDENFEAFLEEKFELQTGALATVLTNFLGLGASLGAAKVAPGTALTLLAVGVAGYFIYRIVRSVERVLE